MTIFGVKNDRAALRGAATGAEKTKRVKTPLLGILAVVLVIVVGIVHVASIVLATGGDYELASFMAIAAIAGSVVSLVMGAIAAIAGLGRWWGLIAMVISIVVNPFVLLKVLTFFSGVTGGY